jgi:UDP-glucuronate decarboxylase
MQALRDEPITVYGEGSQTRCFCYVDDMVEGLIRLMGSDDDFTGPVNLGNSSEFTIRELAEKIIDMTNSGSKLHFSPLPEDDPLIRKPDTNLAKEKLNWEAKTELDAGLSQAVEYFKNYIENHLFRE